MMDVVNEMFALRGRERMQLTEERPLSGRWLAVQLRSIEMPAGQRAQLTHCGQPVAQAAVLACEYVKKHGGWQWTQLTPATKEAIGSYLLDDCKATWDRWYYLEILPPEEPPCD